MRGDVRVIERRTVLDDIAADHAQTREATNEL
jgi:hypothetical protein